MTASRVHFRISLAPNPRGMWMRTALAAGAILSGAAVCGCGSSVGTSADLQALAMCTHGGNDVAPGCDVALYLPATARAREEVNRGVFDLRPGSTLMECAQCRRAEAGVQLVPVYVVRVPLEDAGAFLEAGWRPGPLRPGLSCDADPDGELACPGPLREGQPVDADSAF